MDTVALLEKLASVEGRRQLQQLDRSAGANCKVIAGAIEAIPPAKLAQRQDLQEIFDGLLEIRHAEIMKAISKKITEFNIDQTNAHPWIRQWAHEQQYGKTRHTIDYADDAFNAIGDHIRETAIKTQARAFFGKDLTEISQASFAQEIQNMDPPQLLEKLASGQGRIQLYNLYAYNTVHYDLAGKAILAIPNELLAPHPKAQEIITALLTGPTKHKNTLEAIVEKIESLSVEQTNQNPWIADITVDRSIREIYGSEKSLTKINNHLHKVNQFNRAELFFGHRVNDITSTEFAQEIQAMSPDELLQAITDPSRHRALVQMEAATQAYGELTAQAISRIPPELWPQGTELSETFGALMQYQNPKTLAAIVDVIERLPDETLLAQDDKGSKYHNRLVEWGFSSDVMSASNATSSKNPVVEIVQRVTSAAKDRANQNLFFGTSASPTPAIGDR